MDACFMLQHIPTRLGHQLFDLFFIYFCLILQQILHNKEIILNNYYNLHIHQQ